MNVLHICPRNNDLIHRHVSMLVERLRQSANVQIADTNRSISKQAQAMQADIIHIHGINQWLHVKALRCAKKLNIRTVVTPHGQLQPFAINMLPIYQRTAILVFQRELIEHAYAIITLGKMEHTAFLSLGWNSRVEEIHNAVITNTITPMEMASQTFSIYQKVLDSNTLEQMDQHSVRMLAAILKAGITGDKRWVDTSSIDSRLTDWRRLLIYAEHENISNYTDYGIRMLNLSTPLIDTSKIASYFPNRYHRPQPIKELIGDYNGDETDYLIRMIRQILKAPTLLNLIELTRELYRDTISDDVLSETLQEAGLEKRTARLIQILKEQVMLDEGFMPIKPVDDHLTNHLRNHLKSHLKI